MPRPTEKLTCTSQPILSYLPMSNPTSELCRPEIAHVVFVGVSKMAIPTIGSSQTTQPRQSLLGSDSQSPVMVTERHFRDGIVNSGITFGSQHAYAWLHRVDAATKRKTDYSLFPSASSTSNAFTCFGSFLCSDSTRRSTFLMSSDGGSCSGTMPRLANSFRTSVLF